MKTFKQFLLIFFVVYPVINAQSISEKFASAMSYYNNSEYAAAYSIFHELSSQKNLDDKVASSSGYYSADCLVKMQQFDGAVAEFEEYIDRYPLSQFRDDALYRLGSIYFSKKEYGKCRERLMTLINSYPSSEFTGNALYLVGESFAAENKFLEAEDFLKNAISSKTNNKYVDYSVYSLAGIYERTKDYNEAVKYYDQLLTYYNDSPLAPSAQMRIGICYFNLKEYDHAVLELSDPLVQKLNRDDQTEALYFLATSFFRLKDYNNASSMYKQIIDKYKDPAIVSQIRYGLAWVNFQRGEYNDAYKEFESLSQTGDDSIAVNSLYWSGECKKYLGETDAAIKIFDDFLKKYPQSKLADNARFNIGTVYYNTKDLAKSERLLIEATKSNDKLTRAKAFTLLGEISLNKEDYKTAATYFDNVVNISSVTQDLISRAKFGMGVAQYYMNKFDDAIDNLSDINSGSKEFEKDKVNFYLAEAYFAKGNFSKALSYYNQVDLSNKETGRQALYGKAYCYFNLKDFANAVKYFTEYTSRYKNDANISDAKLRLADSYYGTKNFDKASDIYQEIFSHSSSLLNNDYAYYQFGQALFKAGRSDEAIDKFVTLQRKFPRSKYVDDSQYLIGWINFQKGAFEKAIENYMELFRRYPQSPIKPIAYYSIGDCYFNLANYDSAIVYYQEVIDKYPNTQYVFDAVNGIQYCYVAKDQPDNAIAFIDRVLVENPTSKYADQISFKKGDIYYSINNYQKAKQAYIDFIDSYPSSPLIQNAYYLVGKCAANLSENDEAVLRFQKAIDMDIKSETGIASVIELGKLYTDSKDYTSAVDIYNKALTAVPNSKRTAELQYMKADALVQAGDMQNAYETFNNVITYYNGTVFASKSKIELGLLELKAKRYENAEQLFKELGESSIDDLGAQAQYYYGVTLLEQDKTNDAISAFVRVRSVFSMYDEWYTKALLKLGDCYVKLNDKKNAREMYKAVLSKHPKGEYAVEANKKLREL